MTMTMTMMRLIDQDLIDAAASHDACTTGMALAVALIGRPVAWLRPSDLRWLWARELTDATYVAPPAAVLSELARDENWLVRWAVAEHIATPADVLAQLAQDPDWQVRWALARRREAEASC